VCSVALLLPLREPRSRGGPDVDDVEDVKAGTYMLNVEDKSTMHDFDLIGPASTRKSPGWYV
jgi:hypothetical protein